MQVSVVYTTGRLEPQIDWVVDEVARQRTAGDDVDLVIVDYHRRTPAGLGIANPPPGISVTCTPPKPCAWQGPQRVTSVDWWAMSNARNTGIVLARHDYVVFLDDRCHLGPRWLSAVREGEQQRVSVLAGTYRKIEDGGTTTDHRLLQHPHGKVNCGGGWLYGCCAALPLAWLLEVNGFEEGCDGLSGEDYILGMMLQNLGRRIDLCADLHVLQDRSVVTRHGLVRRDKGTSPDDKSHAAIRRFGNRRRTEFTPSLRQLRARHAAGDGFPDVDTSSEPRDWYDNQRIADMEAP